MNKSSISRTKDCFRIIVITIIILGLMLVVIEGLASYMLLACDIAKTPSLAERRHTRYDPDLGWVNEPNARIPNMYGPGIYLKTNSRGFRNNYDFDAVVPSGKYRIICSGNSFTFGYGVDNDHTWCQQLTSLDPWLETLNMGQGGYGVDQAYLWYKRDASRIEHQVHILAFVTEDFYRMQSDKFLGYGKPLIDIEKDTLVIKNVPAPRGAYSFSWLISNSENLKRLRIFELLKQFSRKAGIGPENRERLSEKGKNEKTREVLKKIFEDLKRINEERSSKLVLVYLPTPYDIEDNYYPKEWVRYIEKESRDLGVPLINVLDIFRSLPYGDVVKMFIPEGQIKYPGAAGHLNDQGNEFVARVIYQELRNHPVLSQALSPKTAKKKAGADSNEQFSPAGLGR